MISIPTTTRSSKSCSSNNSSCFLFSRPGVLLLTVLIASKISTEHHALQQIQLIRPHQRSRRTASYSPQSHSPCDLFKKKTTNNNPLHSKKHSSSSSSSVVTTRRPRSSSSLLFSLVDDSHHHLEDASTTTASTDTTTTTSSTTTSGSNNSNNNNNNKPRFVIEKIGGGSSSGVGTRASSHASRYYGDYVSGKVYSDISSLCVQTFFGTTQSDDDILLQQTLLQTSTQKLELYQSLQPDELRKRRDDVRVTSEFFVAYELREATPQDVHDFRREQELLQEQERRRGASSSSSSSSSSAKRTQVPYNAHSNDHYYRVDHSVKSPAKMANGYEPYSNRPVGGAAADRDDDEEDNDEGPVVMGGTLGGIAGRRHAREEANARSRRPLKRYRQTGPTTTTTGAASTNDDAWNSYANNGHVRSNERRGPMQDRYSSHYYDPYAMDEPPLVMGGNLGPVGPTPRRRRRRQPTRTGRRGTAGPLFAHRRYQQYQHDFDYFQKPHSSQRAVSNNEQWGVEQPFMVDNGYQYGVESDRHVRYGHERTSSERHQSPPMPHEAKSSAHHTYSSEDGGMSFEYHYTPEFHEQATSSPVREHGLPLEADDFVSFRHDGPSFQNKQRVKRTFHTSNKQQEHIHVHSPAANDIHEKEAPMWVKGDLVGFVEIVHTPYSLGELDDPEMLTAGMKPHRPVLRNLVVAKHARNSGIGTRLLEACERHVQIQWQMKELVVEVDDLWNESKHGDHAAHTSAVEFYRKFGYDVVLSDPESKRYDEETGEVIGQIQCRRDVMRKSFVSDEENVGAATKTGTNDKGCDVDASKIKQQGYGSEDAVDVEYEASFVDRSDAVEASSKRREDIHDPAASVAELITDPKEGPRPPGDSGRESVACDPEGPNRSIFST